MKVWPGGRTTCWLVRNGCSKCSNLRSPDLWTANFFRPRSFLSNTVNIHCFAARANTASCTRFDKVRLYLLVLVRKCSFDEVGTTVDEGGSCVNRIMFGCESVSCLWQKSFWNVAFRSFPYMISCLTPSPPRQLLHQTIFMSPIKRSWSIFWFLFPDVSGLIFLQFFYSTCLTNFLFYFLSIKMINHSCSSDSSLPLEFSASSCQSLLSKCA